MGCDNYSIPNPTSSQPRRRDWKYNILINAQYVFYVFTGVVIKVVHWGYSWFSVLSFIGTSVVFVALFVLSLKVRTRIARKSDDELSYFLTQVVLKEGLLVGLGQVSVGDI